MSEFETAGEPDPATGASPGDEDQPAVSAEAVAYVQTQQRHKSGASWFFWIAGLSLINLLIAFFGGEWGFIFGLGITQAMTAIAIGIGEEAAKDGAESVGTVAKVIAGVLSLGATGLFALLGVLAHRRLIWAFVVGITVYVLDGLLLAAVGDWLSVAFHGFALFGIWGGMQAARQLLGTASPAPAEEPDFGSVWKEP